MELIQPAAETIASLRVPIALRVKYFVKIRKNNDNLQNRVKELAASREDLKLAVERTEREGKLPKNEVKVWLEKADEIIKNAQKMQEEFQQKKKFFYGWCLDCCSRYKLGKRIVEAIQDVQDHTAKKTSFGEISVPPLRESVQELPTTTVRKGTSTSNSLERVRYWLMDSKTGVIGIWGKGGVGKTTLVKNINNQLRGTQQFEVVIFVTVSRDCNIEKLRNDIGKEIGEEIYSELSKEKDETRASRLLFNKLRRKRYLLILDDMWEKVDLEKLGVPTPKENSGCKIVITTRKRGVCKHMETDKEIKVDGLSDKEAWELFEEKAGSVISSDIEPIARDVCKECDGLPLAIVVVGRALRKETDVEVWKNARRVLRSARFEEIQGMKDEVYFRLKFSYDHLETENLRNCFLYCSLFPEDYQIHVHRLIEYWTMEGFIEGVESLADASAKGHHLLKELINSCLLEKEGIGKVKMHDVIRDMAIEITSESTERGRRFLIRAGMGLKECSVLEKWEGKDRISLMENDIRSLPDEPKGTELYTLLLQRNRFLREIPLLFFKQMKNLRVLDLSDTGVESLPPSISELGSLQALILGGCTKLKSVTHVGRLEQLQLLDLCYTGIVELPSEIGQLTRLRRLDLSWTLQLVRIPADKIVSLSLLEHLDMAESSYFLRNKESEAFIERRGHLNQLTYFSACIPGDLRTKFQPWHKLKSFYIRIGAEVEEDFFSLAFRFYLYDRGSDMFRERRLIMTGNAKVSQEAVGLLQYAEILRLWDQKEVRTISTMGARNLKRLKECIVGDCRDMENVVITEEAEEGILPELEILRLHSLPNLRSVWVGNGTQGSFRSIRLIALDSCPNVMHLFSSSVLQLLNSLEELSITSCHRIVEIVTGEVGNGVTALPSLRSIHLQGLPELKRTWEGVLSLESLKEIIVGSCASLRQLAMDIDKTPALEVIRGEREWWDSLEWQNDISKSHFQNKFEIS